MRRGSWAGVVTMLVCALLAASASAHTFCVHVTGSCDASYDTIQAAVDAASTDGTDVDQIRVGAGTYAENVNDGFSNPVVIVGAGQDATTITGASGSSLTVVITGSVLAHLTVAMPANSNSSIYTGIFAQFSAVVRDVKVVPGPNVTDGDGIGVTSAEVVDSTIDLTGATGVNGIRFNSGNAIGDTVKVDNGVGIAYSGGSGTVSRSRIAAPVGVDALLGATGTITVASSLIEPVGAGATGINVRNTFGNGSATIEHDTILGTSASGASSGVLVDPTSTSTATSASATIRNSVVRGFAADLRRLGQPSGGSCGSPPNCPATANATLTFDDYETSTTVSGGPGAVTTGTGNLDADPGLLADRRPAHGSPLIDAGWPFTGGPQTDLLGNPWADGNGDGETIEDIGAFEYQRLAPTAGATVDSTVQTGQPAAFAASGTDPDGEAVTFHWDFGDGTGADGAGQSHAYASAGTKTATLTVTDASGSATTLTRTIVVTSPPATSCAQVAFCPATPRTCKVPKLAKLSLAKATAKLKAAGCKRGKVHRPRISKKVRHPVLVVSSSNPHAGVVVAGGTKVDLTLVRRPAQPKH